MKVLGLLAIFCFSADLVFAQKLRSDPIMFEDCSRNTNSIMIVLESLGGYKLEAINNNKRFDLLRKGLILNELKIREFDDKIKESPGNQALWKAYELAYANYELSLEAIKKWNVSDDKFELNYKLAIKNFQSLRMKISKSCNGSWELGIIRKYCNKASVKHKEFCKQFAS